MNTPDTTQPRETADVHTASPEYAARFSGPAGRWMLALQEAITLRQLAPFAGGTVLDVGGGHGQLALPLAERGWNVTIVGSGPDAQSAAVRAAAKAGRLRYATGDLLALPFPDRSFDIVLCFRLLTHCDRWPALVAELCRTARRAVVVDYPTGQSLNCATSLLFGAKKHIEKNTRTYTLFPHRQIADAFAAHAFRRTAIAKQYFLPMVLHRMLKSPALSRLAEFPFRVLGLTALLGSPAIARFERTDSA
jgi:ubiquinone/menaquinone biosynthesis C-methylase UbiE